MKRIFTLLVVLTTFLLPEAFAQNRDKTLTITVTTDTDDYLQGQPVSLVQTDYSLSYGALKLNAEGVCVVKVYGGNHELTIIRPGYETVTTTFTIADEATAYAVNLHLTEQVRTPFSLTAEMQHDAYTGDNSVLMTWNTEPPAFFDDFEGYEPFAIHFGEWTGIDADLEAAAPIVGDYPNRCVMQYAQIINPLEVTPTWWYDYPILRPFSGKQYVGFTRTSSGNANDDWLISPVVNVGNEHSLIFLGKAADKYDERFQVYITTQTDNPTQKDFVRLDQGNYETADMKGWQAYEYDLSAFAGQQVKFAIRYISHYNRYGSFMLMIDDIYVGQPKGYATAQAKARRSPARTEENPYEVFHIYLDGQEIDTTEDYQYLFRHVTTGSHSFGVKAVYRKAESEIISTTVDISGDYSPVTFLVSTDSHLNADGQVVRLINTATTETYEQTVSDGKATILSLPHGDYVVNIEEGAFNAYQQNIHVAEATTVNITLTDHVITPYNITADTPEGADDGTLLLKWNQELVFSDSFEAYEDFARGEFGEWRSIDLDDMPVYPIALGALTNVIYFPGAGTADKPLPIAPIVFNPWKTQPAMLPTDNAVQAPTGDKTIAFFSPQRAKADKWLISPPVDIREGYTLTTTMKSYDAMYPESVEFCVSTDGAEPTDFTPVSTASNIPAGIWTQYQTDLSAYAGQRVRLAVHYISYDTFFLQLDDFIVGPEDGEAPLVNYGNVLHYDIYVDHTKVQETTTPTCTLTGLSAGTHTIGITAVYEHAVSEMGTITVNVVNGIATITLSPTAPAVIYDLTGHQVNSDVSSLPKGIYLIQTDHQFKKYIKR